MTGIEFILVESLLVLVPFGAGFAAGYKGTWKHSAVVVGALLGLFLTLQAAGGLIFQMPIVKALMGDLLMALLATFGSVIGALFVRKSPAGRVLAVHAGIAAGVFAVIEIIAALTGHL